MFTLLLEYFVKVITLALHGSKITQMFSVCWGGLVVCPLSNLLTYIRSRLAYLGTRTADVQEFGLKGTDSFQKYFDELAAKSFGKAYEHMGGVPRRV